jgi:hypothetical protein
MTTKVTGSWEDFAPQDRHLRGGALVALFSNEALREDHVGGCHQHQRHGSQGHLS